jgi:hypothetical protein
VVGRVVLGYWTKLSGHPAPELPVWTIIRSLGLAPMLIQSRCDIPVIEGIQVGGLDKNNGCKIGQDNTTTK